jgi:hypothetical protein
MFNIILDKCDVHKIYRPTELKIPSQQIQLTIKIPTDMGCGAVG